MKVKQGFIIFLAVLFFTGCVSSKKYNASLSDIEGFKKDISSLQKQLGAEKAEKERLEAELSNLRQKKQRLDAEISGLKEKHEELTEKNKELEDDIVELNRLLEAKKDELTKEVVALKTKLAENKTERDKLTTEVADLKTKLAESRAKGDELATQAAALQAELAENKQRAVELEGELGLKSALILKLETEIKNLSEEKAKTLKEKERAIAEMKGTYDNLVTEMKSEIDKGEIEITQLRNKLSVSMVDKILFPSGSADIKKNGKKVLDRVGEILKKVTGKQIRVEGHTDNKPIGSRLKKKFPTNWELSTARANNVVRYLQEKAGIDPGRLIAAGYAEYRPVTSNDTKEGRAKNRRIEIVLIPLERP